MICIIKLICFEIIRPQTSLNCFITQKNMWYYLKWPYFICHRYDTCRKKLVLKRRYGTIPIISVSPIYRDNCNNYIGPSLIRSDSHFPIPIEERGTPLRLRPHNFACIVCKVDDIDLLRAVEEHPAHPGRRGAHDAQRPHVAYGKKF